MDIKGSIALVTGANRGLGKAFVQALLDAGAQKVYVTARYLTGVSDSRLQPLKLDITNEYDIATVAKMCQDVNILINNAGMVPAKPLLAAQSMDGAHEEMQTNYFGTLDMCRAFAPILKKNGGGALVNILSVVSWFTNPVNGSYCASKAAEWSLTSGLRVELRPQGTLVVGVYAGVIDTDMSARLNEARTSPVDVATQTIEAIRASCEEVLSDRHSRQVRAALAADPQAVSQSLQQLWDSGMWRSVVNLS